jgi:hypothetical protein
MRSHRVTCFWFAQLRQRQGHILGTKMDRADGSAVRPDGPRSEQSVLVAQTVCARRISYGSEFLAVFVS